MSTIGTNYRRRPDRLLPQKVLLVLWEAHRTRAGPLFLTDMRRLLSYTIDHDFPLENCLARLLSSRKVISLSDGSYGISERGVADIYSNGNLALEYGLVSASGLMGRLLNSRQHADPHADPA